MYVCCNKHTYSNVIYYYNNRRECDDADASTRHSLQCKAETIEENLNPN